MLIYLPIDNFVCFFVSGSMGSGGRFQWRRCCERKRGRRRKQQVAFMAAATSQDTFLCSMQSPRGFPQEWMQYVLLGLCEWSPLLCMSRFPQRTQNNSGTIFNRKKKKRNCALMFHFLSLNLIQFCRDLNPNGQKSRIWLCIIIFCSLFLHF